MSNTTRKKPLFIAFEGMDGSGKSSISKKVAKKMGAAWHATPPVCFSGIRCKIDKEYKRSGLAAQLFYASSVANASEMVKDNKQSVVLDRYAASAIAYDTIVRNSGLPDKLWINDIFKNIVVPDITLYLCVSPEIRQQRMEERNKISYVYRKIIKMMKELIARYKKVLSQIRMENRSTISSADMKSIEMTKELSARYKKVLSQFQEEKSWNIVCVSNEGSQEDCVQECMDKIEKL